jgi:type IV pilus assembly protein PilO
MQINLRSATTQKWIIVCTLAFGAIYGYVNFLYFPREDECKRLTAEIQKEHDMLAKGKRIAANFQSVQDDYGRLMQSWKMAQELLPSHREMEGLLKAITLEGQERDVNFLLFRPMDPIEKPFYWENPIQIKTLSSYHDLGEFLSAVASLNRIVNVNNLKLSAYKPTKGRSPNTVEADFVATIYVFKELGSSTEVKAPEDPKASKIKKPKPKSVTEEEKQEKGKKV